MNSIITTEDLTEFLKVGDSINRSNQEVLFKKITRAANFEEETMAFRDFGSNHKEVSIPLTLYLDRDNRAYIKEEYTTGIFYKPITYQEELVLYAEQEIKDYIIEITIPNEFFKGSWEFYVNQEDTIVASVQMATLNSLSNYASFQASIFSYLRSYPILNYRYTSVYGNTIADLIEVVPNTESRLIHRFPILSKSFGDGFSYCLSYYYKKDSTEIRGIPPTEDDYPFIGLRIYFKNIATVLQFLNETIFNYYNEFTDYQSRYRNLFLTKLTEKLVPAYNSNKLNARVNVVYHLAQPLFYSLNIKSLWALLEDLSKGYIRNYLSIDEEDLIIKTLRILYFRYTNRQKINTIDGSKVLEDENIGTEEQNNLFLRNLLERKADKKILLYKLIHGLDGEHFKTYVYFIWSIWKNSSYANTDPENNKLITDKSPAIVAYKSEKILGFHTDNLADDWNGSEAKIEFKVRVKVGEKEEAEIINVGYGEEKSRLREASRDIYEIFNYAYHPFSPIVIKNGENPSFILKEQDPEEGSKDTKLPAFLLYANGQTAFWKNVFTGVEYAFDIITTVSGVGNLIKVGRLLRILNKSKTLIGKTKRLTWAITGVKRVTGFIEVTSGTANTLMKLTNFNDTELGKSISKYLFYLEMVCLAGEASVLLYGKLQKSAKTIIENPKFTKSLDDLVRRGEIRKKQKSSIVDEISFVGTGLKSKKVGYVDGLYDAINPKHKPKGFRFTDLPDNEYGKGFYTRVSYGDNKEGYFIRYYNKEEKAFIFSHGFLQIAPFDELPKWVEDVTIPLVKGKGIPTQAYFTLRQMKLLNIPEGGITKVKMTQIQNLETMGYLAKIAKEKGITDFANLNVLEAPSMNYVKTTMEQAGYILKEAKIIFTKITGFSKCKSLRDEGFEITNEYLEKYNLNFEDELLIDFNIEIKVTKR